MCSIILYSLNISVSTYNCRGDYIKSKQIINLLSYLISIKCLGSNYLDYARECMTIPMDFWDNQRRENVYRHF